MSHDNLLKKPFQKYVMIKLLSFSVLSVLAGCQSIDDPTSLAEVQVLENPLPIQGSPIHYEELSQLSASCDQQIAQLYAQKNSLSLELQKKFSIALGNSSKACAHLQKINALLQQAGIFKEQYQQNINYAQFLNNGNITGSLDLPDYFPEAGALEPGLQ